MENALLVLALLAIGFGVFKTGRLYGDWLSKRATALVVVAGAAAGAIMLLLS